LDGVDIKSGIYFIGTTNYPDRIDPAFMNRSGRFDRTYEIGNPLEHTRKKFFESRKIGKLLAEYKVYNDDSIPDSDDGVVDLFVKNSQDLPMASLKELITSTSYLLAADTDMTIEDAVSKSYATLIDSRKKHLEAHQMYNQQQNEYMYRRPMSRFNNIAYSSLEDED
jgi:SpoVK/Ycf46/Vps4 family AAA+-type ATPase